MNVQIFGSKKSPATRKAQRFFSERRIPIHFVDLNEKAASVGELKRFVQKFGVQALIDPESKRFRDLGLHTGYYSDERWLQRLAEEPLILKMPLVRYDNRLTIGDAEAQWKEWTSANR
jgi:arsenate reductase (glutaredoxin)